MPSRRRPSARPGSVKNAEDALRSGPFPVDSRVDALTDIDLSAMVAYHKKQGALVIRWASPGSRNPLEFGIIIVDDDAAASSASWELPTWGQVFSRTPSTPAHHT